jgi:hypothetical protein
MKARLMKTKGKVKGIILMAALLAVLSSFGLASQAVAQTYTCLPTCQENDAKFLVLAGTGYETLAGQEIDLEVSAPSGTTSLIIDIFDGDTGGMWDEGNQESLYTLYADPRGDGSGSLVVGQWYGNSPNVTAGPGWSSSAANMPSNGWWSLMVMTSADSQYINGSGNYFYRMNIKPAGSVTKFLNYFKVRTSGMVVLKPKAFAFMAPFSRLDEAHVIYPSWVDGAPNSQQDLSGTTYDGEFEFHVYVPASSTFFSVWDGDLDFGSRDCSATDSDDLDTGHTLPPWAVGTPALPQGKASAPNTSTYLCKDASGNVIVGTEGQKYTSGAPADDIANRIFERQPSIIYTVTDSNGNEYVNMNPSGNLEWEQFRIDTILSPSPFAGPDYVAATNPLPSGTYHIRVEGVDLHNLNAFHFFYDVIGVCASGNPCKPLVQPYRIGDTVWIDVNRNGMLDGNETGREGVILELLDGNGNPVLDALGNSRTTRTTDLTGYYSFDVQGKIVDVNPFYDPNNPDSGNATITYFDGVYKVRVAGENFYCGDNPDKPGYVGPLCGLTITNPQADQPPNTRRYQVIDQNVLIYDFGYYLPLGGPGDETVSIGDRVWWDYNANGIQDDGEPGITGVKLTLKVDLNRDGKYSDDTRYATTGTDGAYLFPNLYTGANYKVTVDSSNFTTGPLAGFVSSPSQVNLPVCQPACAEVDSNGSPAFTGFPLTGGPTEDLSLDFGYYIPTTTGAWIGDLVWHDLNVNGIQDDGEPGIADVVVQLLNSSGQVIRTTTTNSLGNYYFIGLDPGRYTVRIASSNFTTGGVLAGTSASNWYISPREQGSNRAVDSDGDSSYRSRTITLAAGQYNATIDFGFYQTCINFQKTTLQSEVDAGLPVTYHFRVENCGDLVLHGGAHVYDPLLNPSGDHQIWEGVVWPGEVYEFEETFTPESSFCGDVTNTATAVGHPQLPSGSYKPNVTATAGVTVKVVNCTRGGEACSPGYWKASQHFDSWVGYDTTDSFSEIFGVPYNKTLLQALQAGGGGQAALGRIAVAALLDSSSLNFRYTPEEVIQMVKDAYATGDYVTAKNTLESEWVPKENCPLN